MKHFKEKLIQQNGLMIFVAIFFALVLLGCATTPLQTYIKKNKYEPFEIPRNNWGAGTIVNYKNGAEEIVSKNTTCINLLPDSADVVLSSYTYNLKRENNIELGLPKAFNQNINLQGAFNNSRIKTVVISVVNPKEYMIETTKIKQRIRDFSSTNNQSCLEDAVNAKNIILNRVLSVQSLTYSFLDEKKKKIAIDATILTDINANDSLKTEYLGKTELNISTRTFIGYRSVNFTAGSGQLEAEMKATELNSDDLKKRKLATQMQ